MAISEFEIFKIQKMLSQFCANRNKYYPPDQLLINYRIEDQSIYIFEIRPHWKNPSEKLESMTAKIQYVKSKSLWKLYRQQQNLKWNLYEPFESSKDLSEVLKIIDEDAHGCFWG